MKIALTWIGLLLGVSVYAVIELLQAPQFVTVTLASGLIIFGTLLQLNYGNTPFVRNAIVSLAIAVIFAFIFGNISQVSDTLSSLPLLSLTLLSTYAISSYAYVYLIQKRLHFPYADLFEFSWNSAFVIFIATVFTGTLWIILFLFGSLLAMLDAHFFITFITEPAFLYIATFTCIGTGIAIAKQYLHIITSLRNILFGFAQLILPIIAALGFLFIIVMLIKWQPEQFNSLVLIILPVLAIVTLNAVIQKGDYQGVYPRWLQLIISGYFCIQPLLLAMIIYHLWLVMQKEGLNPLPIQLFVISILVALYAICYATTSFCVKKSWFYYLPAINRVLALIVVATTLLIGTGLLDPFKLSVTNQTQRLLQGISSPNTYGIKTYLRGAHLSKADLRGRDMSYFDLQGADLSWANLSGANLSYSDLSGALLQFAILNNANLAGVDFSGANISDASLHDAILTNSFLHLAIGLTQAQLDSACGKQVTLHHGKTIAPLAPASLPEGLEFRQCNELREYNSNKDELALQIN